MKLAALFLDRDGVVNVDRDYVHRSDEFTFVYGIFDLVRHANQRGLLVIIVTNQSGIARGFYSEADFLALTDWMKGEFAKRGARIDAVYYCPFHPTEGIGVYRQDHKNRKPKPGMLLDAAQDYGIDLRRSLFIGDRESDMQAGLAGNIGTLLWLRGPPEGGVAGVVSIVCLSDAQAYLDQAWS